MNEGTSNDKTTVTRTKKSRNRTQKEEKEHHYQQLFPEYQTVHVHSLYFINQCSTAAELEYLIKNAEKTNKFMIDIESDRDTNEPALIQIFFVHAVHDSSPLLLVETKHLPSQLSPTFVQIQHLFHLIFRLDSEIFCWGDLHKELSSFVRFNLFYFPLPSPTHNTQASFRLWFNEWLNEQTNNCNNSIIDNNVVITNAPYDPLIFLPPDVINALKINKKENWSIQDAVAYLFQQHLSKQYTLQTWSCGLDPRLSIKFNKYSSTFRNKMITYAMNDVLALAQIVSFMMASSIPILPPDVSTKGEYKKKQILNLNKLSDAIQLSDDDSSSSEIFLDQVVTVHDKNERHSLQPSSIEPFHQQPTSIDSTNVNVEPMSTPNVHLVKSKTRRTRSLECKKRRNQKANRRHRRNRYNFELIRSVNTTITNVKKVLRSYAVPYLNINIVNSKFYIGLKSQVYQDYFDKRLPMDLFL